MAAPIGAENLARAALARNDRYLREFVEALNLCPFAKRCREEGRLVRRVILDGYLLPALLRAAAEVEGLAEKQCEDRLLGVPRLTEGAGAYGAVSAHARQTRRE